MYLLLFFTHCTATFTFYVKLKKVDDALSIFLKNVLKYSQVFIILIFFLSTTDLKKIPLFYLCDWGKSEENGIGKFKIYVLF